MCPSHALLLNQLQHLCTPPPPAQVASHRLSNEQHYDFAMRTLKSVLLIAAQLRAAEEGGALSVDAEASLVRVALLRCNMSKLKAADSQVRVCVCVRMKHALPSPAPALRVPQIFLGAVEHVRPLCCLFPALPMS